MNEWIWEDKIDSLAVTVCSSQHKVFPNEEPSADVTITLYWGHVHHWLVRHHFTTYDFTSTCCKVKRRWQWHKTPAVLHLRRLFQTCHLVQGPGEDGKSGSWEESSSCCSGLSFLSCPPVVFIYPGMLSQYICGFILYIVMHLAASSEGLHSHPDIYGWVSSYASVMQFFHPNSKYKTFSSPHKYWMIKTRGCCQ